MIGARVQNANQRIEFEETVKIYNAAKINLNLHSSTYHTGVNPDGDFVNPRTFEIAACGGFQLVDERLELGELLEPGEEVATFRSIDELTQKIHHYLAHGEEARAIAGRGRERVLKEHTLQQRMREMLIHVFTDRMDDLRERVGKRERDTVDYCIEQVGAETELGRYLGQFRGVPDFSLKTITDYIENGKGALNKTELLMLMLDHPLPVASTELPQSFQSQHSYRIPATRSTRGTAEIYALTGQRVQVLVSEEQSPGRYRRIWDGLNSQGHPVASGMYFSRLKAGRYTQVAKMLLIR